MKLFGKEVSRKLLIVLTILLSPFIYNLDAIQGRIKFEIMCRKEGGVRFYGHAERNAGWLVQGSINGVDAAESTNTQPFNFGDINFVRYKDRTGKEMDVRLSDPSAFGETKFTSSLSDPALMPRYRYEHTTERLAEDTRFTRTIRTVAEISGNRTLAEHISFGYRWAERERIILSAPSMTTCHSELSSVLKFYRGIYNDREKS